jgi:hypothetical protein
MNAAAITATAKKHWVPIALGVASLAVVGVTLFVLPGYFTELKTAADAQASVAGSLNGVRQAGNSLTEPVLKPGAEAKPMPGLPSPQAVEKATAALSALSKQADEVVNKLVESNVRQPVFAPGLFSATVEKPTAFNFTQFQLAYLARLNATPTRTPKEAEEQRQKSILGGDLKSTSPPTQAELNAIIQQETARLQEGLVRDQSTGQILNKTQIDADIAKMRSELPARLRADRANRFLCYVSPDAFAVDPRMINPQQPPTSTVETFNAQMTLWQQEVIAAAIASTNAELGATKVADAAIKHVVSLQLRWSPVPVQAAPTPGGFGSGGFGAPAPAPDPAAAAAPAELTVDPAAAITRNHAFNAIGHVSNSMYDPYPFLLTLRVDSRRIPQILDALPRHRLLAINNVNISSVDVGLAAQQGYIYGADPICELVLEGDIIFVRSWLIPYMPPPAKAYFSTKSAGPPPPAG